MELVLTRLAGTETWSGPVLRMSQWGPGSPESKPRPHLTTESPEAGQLTVGSALALPLWFPPPGLLTQKVMCYVGNSPRTWGRVFLQAQLPVSCIPAPHSSYLPTCVFILMHLRDRLGSLNTERAWRGQGRVQQHSTLQPSIIHNTQQPQHCRSYSLCSALQCSA